MPSLKFALDPGGPERLEVSFSGMWKDIVVHLDGQPIGAIPSVIELHQGQSFTLPDGSVLHIVKRTRSLGNVELQVTRDGKLLPGAGADPAQQVKWAAHILYLVAMFTGLGGLRALVYQPPEFAQPVILAWIDLISGGVYAILGFFTQRGSRAALLNATVFYTVASVANFAMRMQVTGRVPTLLLLRFALIPPLLHGYRAMSELQRGPGDAPGA